MIGRICPQSATRRRLARSVVNLNSAGCSLGGIIKSTLILADMNDFSTVDQIYAGWLPDDRVICNPARTVYEAALPHGALVMLDVVATFPS